MKKIIFSLLAVVVLFSQVAKPVLAQSQTSGTWYNQSFQEWSGKVYDTTNPQEIFGERYTAAQVQWVIYGLASYMITGGDPTVSKMLSCASTTEAANCLDLVIEEVGKNMPTEQPSASIQNQPAKSALAFIIQKPMSGIGYLAGMASKIHLISEVQAQGYGYEANSFSLELWKVARNLSFALLTLAVVIMSFMIMFRVKISPQLVISVQSALPKVVLAMILITFSYAIAGLLIDIMYVVIGLLAAILTAPGSLAKEGNWYKLFQNMVGSDPFWLLGRYYLGMIALFIKAASIPFALLVASFSIPVVGIFILIALLVILVIMFFVTSIKIVLLMIKTFVNITFLTVTAPLRILLGTVLPDQGFGPWLRSMAANLAIYPMVAAMFFLAFFFLRQGWGDFFTGNPEAPKWINWLFTWLPNDPTGSITWDPPLTIWLNSQPGASQSGLLFLALSYSVIHLIPKSAQILKSVMERKPFDYGTAIGEAIGPIRAVAPGVAEVASTGTFPDFLSKIKVGRGKTIGTAYRGWKADHPTESTRLKQTIDFLNSLLGGQKRR